jgi:hypothetical protein
MCHLQRLYQRRGLVLTYGSDDGRTMAPAVERKVDGVILRHPTLSVFHPNIEPTTRERVKRCC